MKFNTIIIDDEEPARERIKRLLVNHSNIIEIIGEADDGESAYKIINKKRPDLIFLDIQMPIYNGFEVLKKLEYDPLIIFTTAYEEYALNAFDNFAIDYLLKPISEERLRLSIDKIEKYSFDQIKKINYLLNNNDIKKAKHITINIGDKIKFIPLKNITHLIAKDKYINIYEINKKERIIADTLANLEKRLPNNFLRIHRSKIINTDHIYEVHKSIGGRFKFIVEDRKSTELTSSLSYSEQIKEHLDL
jgi:two-component system LytT family response regulator